MKTPNPYTVTNSDFTHHIDVVCPRCDKKALVKGAHLYLPMADLEEKVSFSCLSCGYNIKYANTPKLTVYVNSKGVPKYSRLLHLNTAIDPFFGFTLWYILEANDGILWAYNNEHLSIIEHYIAVPLRERNGLPHQNNSLASRLPKWVSAAKNRDYLLRLIARVRQK